MALLHGVISNLLSLGAKLLPFATAPAAQVPSSSSSLAAETRQIESDGEIFMKVLKQMKATLHDAEGREISDDSVKLLLKKLKLLDHSSTQAPSSSSSPPAENHQIGAELESLMRMLEWIKATLYDAEEREISDKSVKLCLKELRGVAYHAEDVLDEYHYELLRAQVEARDASSPNPRKRKQVQMPDGMFDQIKRIKGRFEEICKDRKRLQLTDEHGPRRTNNELQIAPTSPFVVESNIFGREEEKERLIDLLSFECDDNVVSVVTIVGTGGLGKTTLAQLSYNDQRIQQRFRKRGWLCVSEDFNVERLTRESIESITGSRCDLRNLGDLQNKISEVIIGQRVLLVLDDVWNENRSMWELFQIPFRSAELVKILVTTRNEPVAQIMQTVPTFKLGYLPEEQCWRLFQRYAFGEVNQNEGSKMVEIGKQIMKKCGMLPLAVKSIASLLRHETEEEGWRDILDSELWKSEARNEIFVPLEISYARLPTYLKPCFLYCSMFPKDHIYQVGELVQLWIYQGYIESHGKKNVKKIGWEYAKQLFQRSFFEGIYKAKKFHKTQFKLHDMVHDLARFHSENGCYSIEVGKVLDLPNELYHLYVGEGADLVEPLPSSMFAALRTLIVDFGAKNFLNTFDFLVAQKLRALVLQSEVCEEVLFSVDILKHLRFLSLDSLDLERLPECISSLYSLQNLTLRNSYSLRELPENIGNLVNLEELVIDICCNVRVLPASLCQLQMLTKLVLLQCKYLEELPINIGTLTNLQTLEMTDSNLRVLPVSLCQLKALTELILVDGELEELPIDIGSITNLQTLDISGSHLRVLPVSLCQLKALTSLVLARCSKLEKIPFDIGSLTNLQTLVITGNPNSVSCRPLSLSKLKRIQTLKVRLKCETIGWLRDCIDLQGTLCLGGLNHITSLADVQCGNLVSMHNLECLKLIWGLSTRLTGQGEEDDYELDEKEVSLEVESCPNTFPDGQNDFSLMDRLQPHPNLRELHILDYGGIAFPNWIRNPISCASLETIAIEGCKNLTFLPFGSLCKLKYLRISQCSSLRFLAAESLPLELQELEIDECGELISVPGIQKLKSLVHLYIMDCKKLYFLVLVMHAEPSVEVTMRTNESSYQNSLLGLRNLTSLRSLKILRCPRLQLLEDELLHVESCKVEVWDCPGLKEWCLQHNIFWCLQHNISWCLQRSLRHNITYKSEFEPECEAEP